MQWQVNNSCGKKHTRQRIWTRSTEEYKRSAGEELTQCDYSKIESVIINCKFRLMIYPINRDIKSRTRSLLTRYQVTCHNNYLNSKFLQQLLTHCLHNQNRSMLGLLIIVASIVIWRIVFISVFVLGWHCSPFMILSTLQQFAVLYTDWSGWYFSAWSVGYKMNQVIIQVEAIIVRCKLYIRIGN
jgi:hypothetical protein